MKDDIEKSKFGDVRIVKDCMICRREVIFMAIKNNTIMPENNSIMPKVCDECTKKYLSEGILLINPDNGALVVIKDSLFLKIFENTSIPDCRICFTEQNVLDFINNLYNNLNVD